MRALVNTAPGRLDWQEVPAPLPTAGQVRVRTAACGICATDLAMIDGWERTGFPAIPGHEWSGVVESVGAGVDARVVGRPCVAQNVLSDGGEVGFEHPGGYGELLVTEAGSLHLLPEAFPLHVAVLIEPLAVCVRALRRLRPEGLPAVLVIGDGPIGLLLVLLLRAHGVEQVALAGGRPARLELARSLGARAVANYHEAGADLPAALAALPGAPFPGVIEASGTAAGMGAALQLAARGGRVAVVGDYGAARAGFAWNQLLHRELELIGSNASAGAWPEAVQLAVDGCLPLERLVSRCFPVAEAAAAFACVRHSRDVVKVVLSWGERP